MLKQALIVKGEIAVARPFIYTISRGYTRCVVWTGAKNHSRIGISTIVPDKGLTRRERYEIINKWLQERCGLKTPVHYDGKL